jgi:hypothetical protein
LDGCPPEGALLSPGKALKLFMVFVHSARLLHGLKAVADYRFLTVAVLLTKKDGRTW